MPSSPSCFHVLESALAVASLLLHAISWYTKTYALAAFSADLRLHCDAGEPNRGATIACRPREASEEFVEYARCNDHYAMSLHFCVTKVTMHSHCTVLGPSAYIAVRSDLTTGSLIELI